ncbi:MAG: sugar phosphate isomerase/epimerase [Anaerolineae bacterium]|nr:sugar phosphate isomerase/epimerase [Anaerolineae bacterium]
MIWGYALVWMKQYLELDPDPLYAKLKLLKKYDLKTTGIGIQQVDNMSDAERDKLGAFLEENDLYLTVRPHIDFFNADVNVAKQQAEEGARLIEKYRALTRTPLATVGAGRIHRFTREPSLAQQIDRLAEVLPVLAAACHEMDLPLGIENHGDYYCSDLVELCQRVPHLGIFLDTGNTYLIGEAPMPAFETAAPYVVGSHFKDHHVRPCPDARPLHFEVAPSIIGDGDVPLRECYALLLEKAPHPDRLVMEIELIPPSDVDPMESFERSVDFIRSLEARA